MEQQTLTLPPVRPPAKRVIIESILSWLIGFVLLVSGSAIPIAFVAALSLPHPKAAADVLPDITAEADTYASQGSPDTSMAGLTYWGVSGGTLYGGIAYLRFNVSGLPAGATITDARLIAVCQNASAVTGGTLRQFTPTTAQWIESQPTWTNQLPGTDGADLASLGAVVVDQTYEFTGLAGAVTGNGFVTFKIVSTSEDGAKFYSKEHTNASQRPKLRITYTPAPAGTVATPTISPAGGLISGSISVTLATATSGAAIRYTIDGSTPTKDSALYATALVINADTTVKAQAFKSGMADSVIAMASFSTNSGSSTVITKTGFDASPRSSGWSDSSNNEIYCWSPPQWIEYTLTFPAAGSWTFSLTARNQTNSAAPGLPSGYAYNIAVSVDGASNGSFNVPGHTSVFQTGTSSPITLSAGSHTVRFTWTNDAYLAGVYDANIRVKEVGFTGPPSSGAFTLVSPAHNSLAEADAVVAVKSTGGTLTGTLEYQLLMDAAVVQNWSTTAPSSWTPTVADRGKRTLTLKVRNSPTGTPEQDTSDVYVIRIPVSHP